MWVEMTERRYADLEKGLVPQMIMQKPISVTLGDSKRKMIEMNKWLWRVVSNVRPWWKTSARRMLRVRKMKNAAKEEGFCREFYR
jgi:hypothetical protein